MQKLNCTIPSNVQTISISLALPAPDSVVALTDDDRQMLAAEKEREQAWVREHYGDFTDAEREGKWRDGQTLFDSQSLYTGALVDDLIKAGFKLVDAHATFVTIGDSQKPKTVFTFSKVLNPTTRLKSNSVETARTMLRRKWYKCDGYINGRRQVPNIQILVAGDYRNKGSMSDLRLGTQEVAVPTEA